MKIIRNQPFNLRNLSLSRITTSHTRTRNREAAAAALDRLRFWMPPCGVSHLPKSMAMFEAIADAVAFDEP